MPTYEYCCGKCGKKLEASQKITDAPLRKCPSCKAQALVRGPGGGIGLQFQGEGFYITDYGPQKRSKSDCQKEGGGTGQCCPCDKNS